MDIRVLGSVSARGPDGDDIALGGPKQRSLLAMLALDANTVVSVDALAEGVWGEAVPDRYVQNVQVYVSTLRRSLEPERPARMPSRLQARGVGYELVLGPDELDLSRFRALATEGMRLLEAQQPTLAATSFRAGLDEWRGEVCSDLAYQPFVDSARRLLAEERASAFDSCIDAELASGLGGELIAELEAAVERWPEREHAWRHLTIALYRAGRQADAVRCCQRARDRLTEELGLDPGPALRELERQLLDQSPELDPPRQASVRVAPVPVPLTSLIGREDDVANVLDHIADERLVVLTGPGGVGKTRLALAVAAEYVDRGGHVFFVDLSAELDPTRALAALATAANVSESTSVDDVAAVFNELGALVIVDNFEQVLSAAPTIAAIAQRASSARLLVTSRSRLSVPGEFVLGIDPLPIEGRAAPAVELFWERVRDVDRRLDRSVFEDAAMSICSLLEGMPLAIEIAASRVDVLDPAILATRLATALGSILDTGTDAHRQGSLRAAVRWSTDLLSDEERRLFAVLSVCEDAVDISAVAALGVAAGLDTSQAETALERLVRASLIRAIESFPVRRYAFLITTKTAARELLDANTEVAAREAHAEWFAQQSCKRFLEDEDYGQSAIACATAELADSIAAIRWSATRDPDRATQLLGAISRAANVGVVGRARIESLATELLSGDQLPAPFERRARVIAGVMSYLLGAPERAVTLLNAVDELDAHDPWFRSWGFSWRAACLADLDQFEAAWASLESSLRHAVESNQRRLVSFAWGTSSYVALRSGSIERALTCAENELACATTDAMAVDSALISSANALLAAGRLEEARQRATDGLLNAVNAGSRVSKGEAYRCLAWCHILLDDPTTAAGCLLEQLGVVSPSGGDVDVTRLGEAAAATAIVVASVGRGDAQRWWSAGRSLMAGADLDFPRPMLDAAQRLGLYVDAVPTPQAEDLLAEMIPVLELVRGSSVRSAGVEPTTF